MKEKHSLIWAHRGFAARYPENTMIAFEKALEAGADGIELDVQLTKDGMPVVIHDEQIDRTTTGSGWVNALTYEELAGFDAGSWFDESFSDERIPRLEDVLDLMEEHAFLLNIELKNGLVPYEQLEDIVLKAIRDRALDDRIVLSSFNHYSLKKVREMHPTMETAALFMEGLYEPWTYIRSFQATSLHCFFPVAVPDMIQGAKRNETPLRAFTVNDEAHLKNLIHQRIDGVITDDPEKAVRIRTMIIEESD